MQPMNFYPRPPGGGRRGHGFHVYYLLEISIHALRVEGDVCLAARANLESDFYPRPPGGGRLVLCKAIQPRHEISIHALRVEGDSSISLLSFRSCLISIHALRVEGDFLFFCCRAL